MVHTNVFVPVIKLVTVDVFNVGVVTLEPPAITVHNPVPTTGVLPASVNVDAHKFCVVPALAPVGLSST